jgi:hypothetical protein
MRRGRKKMMEVRRRKSLCCEYVYVVVIERASE